MSSPPEGKLETKAGHPPAVKAGGMRIVQKHPHSGDTKEERDKDDQEWESPRGPWRQRLARPQPPQADRVHLRSDRPGKPVDRALGTLPSCHRAVRG
ncbi:death-associated protein 1 isoform X3 [Canis lupus baileyi]|uniref:death-associated protein 1 isoform X3 n=1 Tax=Canis lupus familiaris TaxID=9615 RepID=UPI000BAA3209|nr:death-associated protein 1 isoform X3 [Canis lupus familiaris]XP_025307364.1 death-associated protein 1 isoform X3 [Canis lupus dingo]XP_038301412.1 death-associated protein 1 isoform X3 [Canis lupus familiaris]XP_038439244.1 death-associated protein 1 isoform X3 [Canis lupus familiaris]|eukprot:XP_022270059.1 death-associated protein 1 isoform X3 [Canis lupus familiaris]